MSFGRNSQNCQDQVSYLHRSKREGGSGHFFIANFQGRNQGLTVLYDFEVVRDGNVILTETIQLPHISHAWPAINRLARKFHERGHKIRVKDQTGGIVILTGVAAVRHHEDAEPTA